MGQREIMLHTIMTLQQQQQHEMSMQFLKALQPYDERDFELAESAANSTTAETVPNEVRTTQTTATRMSEPFRVEKAAQNMEKLQTPYESYHEAEKIARHLHDLKNSYILLAHSRSLLSLQYEKDVENIPQLDIRADIMEDKIENIHKMRDYVAELKAERRSLYFWQRKRKRELDVEIERVEADVRVAENYFNSDYHIPLREAPFEVKRIRKEARVKERDLERKTAKIAEITKELEALDTKYRTQWELAKKRADIGLIGDLLLQMEKPYISARDTLRQVQVWRTFDTAKNKKSGKS